MLSKKFCSHRFIAYRSLNKFAFQSKAGHPHVYIYLYLYNTGLDTDSYNLNRTDRQTDVTKIFTTGNEQFTEQITIITFIS